MEVLDTLKAGLSDRFDIRRAVGEGGMAYVYEAIDVKHGRQVAIKVLKPEISSDLGAERFLREIRIVARLSHPHLMPLHESGEVGGLLYYVMPFVTGESLRDRLQRTPLLTIAESLRIVREVSHALAYAHAQGIVHRDLKPANIMLSGGIAVVTDFGIARAQEFVGAEQLTHVGLAIGTPTYMSPEQASGEGEIDARSDIYSLGCILHEMLSGAPPFRGPSALALIAQHAAEPVPDLQQTHPHVPPMLARLVRSALAKSPADRPATIDDFLRALDDATSRSGRFAATRLPRARALRYAAAAAVVAVVVAAGAWIALRPSSADAMPRIAVLPFEHQGPDEQKYFTEGITDEISNRIAEVSGIGVVSRASALQFSLPGNSLGEIADKLKVDYVLVGTIRIDQRPDGTPLVRVVPKLVNVVTGQEVALEKLDAALVPGELFAVQSAIARDVARALDVALSPEATEALALRPTTNLQAYNLYLRGILHASQFLVREEQVKAIEMFEQAVRIDPQFALAHARLSQAEALYYVVFARTPERLRRWERALERATALAPSLAQTKVARGQWHFYARRDAKRAMAEIAELRQLQPNNTELLWLLARVQRTRGDFAGALRSFDAVAALDPRSAIFPFESATALFMLHRFDEAIARLDQAAALAPDWPPPRISRPRLLMLVGRDEEAQRVLAELEPQLPALLPQFIGEPLYRDLWDTTYPASYQEALARVTMEESRSDSAEYYQSKGHLYLRRDDAERQRAYFDSALTVLTRRRADGASSVFIHVDIGTALAGAGRRQEARLYADSAAAADLVGEDAFRGWFATFQLARLYARLQANDEALAILERLKAKGVPVPVPMLRRDPSFAALQANRRMQALLALQ